MTDRPEAQPGFDDPTSLGETVKLFGGSRATMVRRDLESFDEVFELALSTTRASDRIVMKRTVVETRAIAQLAVTAGVIASKVAEIVNRFDAGASKDELVAKLDALTEAMRPLTVTA